MTSHSPYEEYFGGNSPWSASVAHLLNLSFSIRPILDKEKPISAKDSVFICQPIEPSSFNFIFQTWLMLRLISCPEATNDLASLDSIFNCISLENNCLPRICILAYPPKPLERGISFQFK